jgi:hypothetical protein
VAGFVGDLCALGLLSMETVNDTVFANLAFVDQVSTIHCRALHLFLLHARDHIGPSIGLETLWHVRRQLIRCTRVPPMSFDRLPQLWVIVSFMNQVRFKALLTVYRRSVVPLSTGRWNKTGLPVKVTANR